MSRKFEASIYGANEDETKVNVLITTDEGSYTLSLMTKIEADKLGQQTSSVYIVEDTEAIDAAYVDALLGSAILTEILPYLIPQNEEG